MTIRKNLRYRVGVIGGALILLSAWFEDADWNQWFDVVNRIATRTPG